MLKVHLHMKTCTDLIRSASKLLQMAQKGAEADAVGELGFVVCVLCAALWG